MEQRFPATLETRASFGGTLTQHGAGLRGPMKKRPTRADQGAGDSTSFLPTEARAQRLMPGRQLRFHHLLFTFMDPVRRRAAYPVLDFSSRLSKEGSTREKVLVEFEEQYGDGHYADRKQRHYELLDWLGANTKIKIETTCRLLRRTKAH